MLANKKSQGDNELRFNWPSWLNLDIEIFFDAGSFVLPVVSI